jgi:hypothetical protein
LFDGDLGPPEAGGDEASGDKRCGDEKRFFREGEHTESMPGRPARVNGSVEPRENERRLRWEEVASQGRKSEVESRRSFGLNFLNVVAHVR